MCRSEGQVFNCLQDGAHYFSLTDDSLAHSQELVIGPVKPGADWPMLLTWLDSGKPKLICQAKLMRKERSNEIVIYDFHRASLPGPRTSAVHPTWKTLPSGDRLALRAFWIPASVWSSPSGTRKHQFALCAGSTLGVTTPHSKISNTACRAP